MTAPPPTAAFPFDRSDVDVVLRSSDGVDFHVYTSILSLASPVFADLFLVPQPPTPAPQDVHSILRVPVVHLAEDSATLDALLRLLYPVPDPALHDATHIARVLEAAAKYEMGEAMSLTQNALRDAAKEEPFRAYAVACRLGLEDVARAAADACARAEFEHVDEMDSISAGALYRLLHFRRIQPRGAGEFTFCTPPESSDAAERATQESAGWKQTQADVALQSSDGVCFPVHRLLLSLASPVLGRRLKQRAQDDSVSPQGLRLIAVPEESTTVRALLQLCYPNGGDPALVGPRETVALLQAARKYEVARAESFAERRWPDAVRAEPLRAYFVAMKSGWEEGARAAAEALVSAREADGYVPEMEYVEAKVYRRLLQFRARYAEALAGAEARYTGIQGSRRHWSDIPVQHAAPCSEWVVFESEEGEGAIAAPVLDKYLGLGASAKMPQVLEESRRLRQELRTKLAMVAL